MAAASALFRFIDCMEGSWSVTLGRSWLPSASNVIIVKLSWRAATMSKPRKPSLVEIEWRTSPAYWLTKFTSWHANTSNNSAYLHIKPCAASVTQYHLRSWQIAAAKVNQSYAPSLLCCETAILAIHLTEYNEVEQQLLKWVLVMLCDSLFVHLGTRTRRKADFIVYGLRLTGEVLQNFECLLSACHLIWSILAMWLEKIDTCVDNISSLLKWTSADLPILVAAVAAPNLCHPHFRNSATFEGRDRLFYTAACLIEMASHQLHVCLL